MKHTAIIVLSVLASACATTPYNSNTAWTAGNPNSLYNRTVIVDTEPQEKLIQIYDEIGYENLSERQKTDYINAKLILEDDGVIILEDRLKDRPQYVKDNCVALKLC